MLCVDELYCGGQDFDISSSLITISIMVIISLMIWWTIVIKDKIDRRREKKDGL